MEVIDWTNYVDHIFCITYLPNGKLNKISNTLSNIGININDSKFFSFLYDYEHCIFKDQYQIMKSMSFDTFNKKRYFENSFLDNDKQDYVFYVGMNTYRILKISQYFNYDRIIIFEDDIIFLKDINYIINALDFVNKQNDFDLCLCQTTYVDAYHGIKKYLQVCANDLGNDFFMKTSEPIGVYGGSFVILSKEGIDKIINYYEHYNMAVCIDSLDSLRDKIELRTLFALKPLCIQECMLNWTNEQIEYNNKNMIIAEYI